MGPTRMVEASETGVNGRTPLSAVAEYAYAAVTPATASFVHVAGACPLDNHGETMAVGDVTGQALVSMANLEQALAAAGAGLGDVVKTTVYVASPDQTHLVAAWEVVRDTFTPHRPPSTLLGVAALGYTGQLVEIEAVAAVTASHP